MSNKSFPQTPVLTDEEIKAEFGKYFTEDDMKLPEPIFTTVTQIIAVVREAQRDASDKQWRDLIGVLFWIDDDSKTAGLLVTGSVVYSHLQALKGD